MGVVDDCHILEKVTQGMGVSEAHALVAFLTAAPDNGGEGWLVGAINNKVRFQQLTRSKLSILFQVKEYGAQVPGGTQLIGLGSEDAYFDFVRCCTWLVAQCQL